MGEYEPDDSRDVTLNPGHEPGGIERTGPREGETREQQTRKDDSWRSGEQAGGSAKGKPATGSPGQGGAQMGYGSERDEDGQAEQDEARHAGTGEGAAGGGMAQARPCAASSDPSAQAAADAARPLGKD